MLRLSNPNSFVLYFDNTGGASEGVALRDLGAQSATVPLIVRGDGGNTLASSSKSLPALGHAQFMITDISALTANKRGSLKFQTPPGGQIGVLGIAVLPTGAITSVPATAK